MDGTSVVGQAVADEGEIARLRRRVADLTWVADSAAAERELVMYKAVRAGAAVEQVAGWAMAEPDQVAAIVTRVGADPDADRMPEGPDYRQYWPPGAGGMGNS